MLNPANDAFAARLRDVLPAAAFKTDTAPYLSEPRDRWKGQGLVVAPGSTEEVAAVVKACAAAKIIDRTIVKDSLGLCDAVWPIMSSWNTPDHVGDPTMESRIFHAATGIDIDEAGLNKYGERIFNLQRAILLREGLQPEKDDFPAEFNFTTPVKEIYLNPDVIVPGRGEKVISRKGQTLDRKTYDRMLKEFYKIRGWDPESGLQRGDLLGPQRLSDLARDLNKTD